MEIFIQDFPRGTLRLLFYIEHFTTIQEIALNIFQTKELI